MENIWEMILLTQAQVNGNDFFYIVEEVLGKIIFKGSIDDVMIFNRSLSQEEIQALYSNQSVKYLAKSLKHLKE
jgi:hypothetical protein